MPACACARRGCGGGMHPEVWRDCVVHENVVQRAPLFPIGRLMVHGVVLGAHGEALAKDLDKFTKQDWAQEVPVEGWWGVAWGCWAVEPAQLGNWPTIESTELGTAQLWPQAIGVVGG